MFWLSDRNRKEKGEIRKLLLAHMRSSQGAQTISHAIKPYERVNLQLALDRWFDKDRTHARFLGGEGLRHSVFRYSMTARRSGSVRSSPKGWPALPRPGRVVS